MFKIPSIILVFIAVLSIISCKKDAYYKDGGLASTTTNLSTYDYLASNSYHYFDTLLLIVDHFGFKDSIDKAGTFFAPTDFAITRMMTDNNVTSLNDLYKRISSKFLTQYMFSDTSLTLNNATINPKTYQSWAATTVGVSKIAASYYVATTSFTYYILQYIKINGVLDKSPNAPVDDEADAILPCQTTGIKTSNGTNLNVLSNIAPLNMVTYPTKLTLTYNVNIPQSNTDYTSSSVQLDSAKIASLFGLTPDQIRNMQASTTSDTLRYYALEPNGNLNKNYTANPPGFWFGSDGSVVSWGNTAYVAAEVDMPSYIAYLTQYPGHGKVGDKYVIKQVFAYTNTYGIHFKATIIFNVTLV